MPDNDYDQLFATLQEQQALLQGLIAKQSEPKEKPSKYLGWIQGLVALITVIVGLGINWGITKTKIEVLDAQIITLEKTIDNRIMKIEEDVHEIQLKQASTDPVIQQIQADVIEIKRDVKSLAEEGR